MTKLSDALQRVFNDPKRMAFEAKWKRFEVDNPTVIIAIKDRDGYRQVYDATRELYRRTGSFQLVLEAAL